MTLKEFLVKLTKPGEIVVFKENGWQIGVTRVDNDDLYLSSINPGLLELYEVVNFSYEQRDWATVNVLVVDILPTYEVREHVRKNMV